MKMKRLGCIMLTLCTLLAFAVILPSGSVGLKASAAYNYSGGTRNSAVFILDPGHGGSDPGACALGRQEAADVLDLSIRVAKLIDGAGSTCSLTRVTDVTQSLATKVSIANSGSFSYFLSIHRNAGGGKGVETYYYTSGSTTSKNLATSVQNAVIATGLWTNRGVKTANYYVVRYTNMAAALVEMGFIDTANDNTIFANNMDTHARAIANGLLAMVGKSVPTTSTKYTSCMDSPSGSSQTNATVTASASVTQNGSSDTMTLAGWTLHSSGVSKVEYCVDGGSYTALTCSTRSDVQAAISGFSDYSNCGFTGTLSYKNLSGGSHTVTIRATTKSNTTYTVATISLSVTDPINPTISDIKVSNVSASGYRVSCTVSDNAGIKSVKFPTWTDSNGQDDIVWHEGTISGSTAYYDVKISEHNNEQGNYITHIYAYDISGNSAGGIGAVIDLTPDEENPVITNAVITNITCFGFDVSCTVTDNRGLSSVKFPTWTDSDWQDDIIWYDATINGSTATLHVDTKDHGNQTGLYHVHLYAWDLWNNVAMVELTVDVPVPTYPTDADYIPINAINGKQYEEDSQLLTTGTFTSQWRGVLVLEAADGGYKVIAKYNSGVVKSVEATATNPIIAVYENLTNAYKAYEGVEVGDIVTLVGAEVSSGRLLEGAYVKLPAKFQLVDNSGYKLDTKYVTVNKTAQTAANINDEFKCTVTVIDAAGTKLDDNGVAGTGCVVQYINATGTVIDSATVVLVGDISGDGIITSADGICVQRMVKGNGEYNDAQQVAADVNGDGIISVLDYVAMQQLCKG